MTLHAMALSTGLSFMALFLMFRPLEIVLPPRRVISAELACPLNRLMGRAPGTKPVAMGMKMRVKHRREHLRNGLADQPIHHSRHPQLPLPARGLGDHHPADRLRPVDARVKPRADLRPMVMQPRPQLLGAHPVDAWGTGVLLHASERLRQIPTGQQPLPQRTGDGGVNVGLVRRRIMAAL